MTENNLILMNDSNIRSGIYTWGRGEHHTNTHKPVFEIAVFLSKKFIH